MGVIGTLAALVAHNAKSFAAKGAPWKSALSRAIAKERQTLARANQEIANRAVQEIGTGGAMVTCSSSATVEAVLLALRPEKISVGEGQPLLDGISAAEWFAARGFCVEVVPDGALPLCVQSARAVVIGADQVLADGSVVNRCSSFSLALAARYFSVPFYVVCQQIKLTGQETSDLEDSSSAAPSKLPAQVQSRIPLFDITGADLINRIITEEASLTPAEAGAVGRSHALIREQVLGF